MMKRKRDTACGKKKMPVASCIILLVIVLGCVFADVICKKDPSYLDLMNYTKAPNAEFWFGQIRWEEIFFPAFGTADGSLC